MRACAGMYVLIISQYLAMPPPLPRPNPTHTHDDDDDDEYDVGSGAVGIIFMFCKEERAGEQGSDIRDNMDMSVGRGG